MSIVNENLINSNNNYYSSVIRQYYRIPYRNINQINPINLLDRPLHNIRNIETQPIISDNNIMTQYERYLYLD
jgi:hypothetical protein